MIEDSISVVIPVYNDQEVLRELHSRLKHVLSDLIADYEIIFVDDGSRDQSFSILKTLLRKDQNLIIIKLKRNFGQSNAITAGLEYAAKDTVVIMDSDLQDRPEDIRVLATSLIQSGKSMAIAKWVERREAFKSRIISNLFFLISDLLTNIRHPKNVGVFRIIRRSVLEEIEKLKFKTGTTLSMLYRTGAEFVTVDLTRDPRYAGKSSYNVIKKFKLAASRIIPNCRFKILFVNRKKIEKKYMPYYEVEEILTENGSRICLKK